MKHTLIILLLISIGILIFDCTHKYKNSSKVQPFIILDAKEIIKTGDTLYVVYASEDSLFLYSK